MTPLQKLSPILCALIACQPLPVEPPGASPSTERLLLLEPDAPLEAAPAVVRARVGLSRADEETASELVLISGELSDYHLGRIEKRDLPQTLVERIVPSLAWNDELAIVIAPSRPLDAGALYTLASPALGRVGTITIEAVPSAPLLARIWPPASEGSGSARALYCADETILLDPTELELSPGNVAASAWREPERCVSIGTEELPLEGTRLIPPPRLGEFALDPTPLEHAPHAAPPPASCGGSELPLGPGCAHVEDDRMRVRSRPESSLWMFSGPGLAAVEPVPADGELVVLGLSPSSTIALDVTVLDLSGREERASVSVTTSAPRARLVLTEVLANPLGPEPQQEWVEIVNDGAIAVSLDGYVLEDLGGATPLPAALLAPGEHALVVRGDFTLDDGLDVVVPAVARLVVVETLGKNGLSNTGEPLILRAPDGTEMSKFPALPKPKAGVSSARRRVFDLDHDPTAFSHHADPGASPGAPNTVP